MHIALISPSWPLGYPNGIVTYVHHLRMGLREVGHRVSVLTIARGPAIEDDGVYRVEASTPSRISRVIGRLSNGGRHAPRPIARLVAESVLRLHALHPVDVVEMEESFGWFDDVARRLPMPLVVKLHGPAFLSLVEEDLSLPATEQKIAAEGEALTRARFVTSPSLDTLERTRRRYSLRPGWGHVIPNPIVMDPQTPQWARAPADPHTLLFVGRFDKRKGGDLVLRAFGKLLQRRPALRLVFVGPDTGLPGADGRRIHIEEFIRTELSEAQAARVTVAGRLDQAAISKLRCQAAVTLVCSRWDNQPNTALEAMLQACPVVGMEAGGLAEVIGHRTTGLLARGGDLNDFCDQVIWMLDHPEAAEQLGLAARKKIQESNGANQIAVQTVDYFQSLLAQAPALALAART